MCDLLFSESIKVKKTGYGLYLQADYDGYVYGQAYPKGVTVKEARQRFIKFYLPMYLADKQ